MHRLCVYLLFVLCLASPLHADYKAFTREAKSSGILAFLQGEDRLDVYFFNSAHMGLQVLDEGEQRRYRQLETALRNNGCIAGMNGGYFSDNASSSPLGTIIHKGKQYTPIAHAAFTVSGILYDTGRGIFLERSRKTSHRASQMKEAIQGGPFLVENGTKTRGLNHTRKARRSFVATDGRGNWCIGVSSPLTLEELADWLTQGALGSFRVRTALNMDGGSSSAFFVRSHGTLVRNAKPVRNYIGISPRKR